MALHAQWPQPPQPDREEDAESDQAYDDIIAASFPASDPPPGVIKLGPTNTRKGTRRSG